jgi:hypothetical protein
MASNPTKDIDIKHHIIRELVDAKIIAVASTGTANMLADGPKKALPEPKHTTIFRRCMGAAQYIVACTCTVTELVLVTGITEYVK